MRVKRSVLRKKDLNAIVVLEDIFSDFRKCHEKCRLCFKSVTEQESRIKFTNDIKNKIHSVLQIDLSLDGIASKFMCPKCENNLDNFHLFKRRIKEKQKYFEKFTNKNIDDTDDELQIPFQQNFIKTENELNISTEMELASPMNKVKEEISEQQHENPSNLDKGRNEETNELQKQDNSNPYFVHGDDHGKVLNNGETTKRHQYVRHLKTKLQCDICGKTLTSRVKIAYHMNTHKKFRKKDFHCEICENSYFGKVQLQKHIFINHERPKHLSCSICRRTFKTKEDLKNHKLLPCRLPCDICGKMLTQANLKRHIDMVHFNMKPCQCDICGKTLTSRVSIAYHMSTHKKFRKKDFHCKICENSYSAKVQLQKHIFINHERPKHLSCSICRRTFKTKEDLKNHKLLPCRLPCDICGKMLTQANLKRHIDMVHFNIKPYQCNICGKTLTSRVNIAYHMNTHKKFRKKDFHCEICENSYFGNDQLQRHVLKNHERPKHLTCSMCRRVFNTQEGLKSHKLRPCILPCDICGKKFKQEYLKQHINRMHINTYGKKNL